MGAGSQLIDADLHGIHKPATISDDGRFVTYCSADTMTGTYVVYSYDLAAKERYLVSRTTAGQVPNGGLSCGNDRSPSTDASGRLVTFSSAADSLVAGDTNNYFDIFAHTISATELSAIYFPVAAITTTKGERYVPISVIRSGPLDRPAQVQAVGHAIDNHTSSLDLDLSSVHVITFAPGQASSSFHILVHNFDPARPPSNTVYLDLYYPLTASLGSPWRLVFTLLNQPPEAITGLSAVSSSPTAIGSATYFTASVIGGAPITYEWGFGDAASATGETSAHTYAAVGNYTVHLTATNAVSTVTTNLIVQVTKRSQSINFAPLSNKTMGEAPFALNASASSGLAVNFSSDTPTICTLTEVTVTLASSGLCTVRATQGGDSTYNAAAEVRQSFTVNPVPRQNQSISFVALGDKRLGDAPFVISASATSGLPVSFTSLTPTTCSVSGNMVTIISVGLCTLRAQQEGNTSYNPAPTVEQSFAIGQAGKIDQTISFTPDPLPDRALGDAAFAVTATASSGLAVRVSATPANVCTLSGATMTVVGAGICIIMAIQEGNANVNPASASRSFNVTNPALQNQSITFAPLPNKALGNPGFALSASASSGLPVSFATLTPTICTVSGVNVTLLAVGTCSIRATQAGNDNFNPAIAVTQSFTISATPVNGSQNVYLPLIRR